MGDKGGEETLPSKQMCERVVVLQKGEESLLKL